MNKKTTPPKTAVIAVAAVVAAFFALHAVSSLSPVFAGIIRESSVYDGNNITGTIHLSMVMTISAAVVMIVILRSKCAALRTENESLRSKCAALRTENESLRSKCAALRTENESLRSKCAALRTENESLREERDSYVRFTRALDESLQQKSETISSLENRLIEWSNRYYSLRSRTTR